MADKAPVSFPPAPPPPDMATLGSLLQDVHTLATDARASRQKKVHEVLHTTAVNPTGAPLPNMKYNAFYQNGGRVNELMLMPEEIVLIAQLKPGLYNKKKWRVTKEPNHGIGLSYSNKSIAQRTDVMKDARSLTEMLQKIILEQESQADRKRRGLPAVDEGDDDDY